MAIPGCFALALAALLAPALPGASVPTGAHNANLVPDRPHRADAWLGDDKLRHLAMSFATTSFAAAAGRAAGLESVAAPAAAAALAAGIGKELYDRRAGAFFSLRDLAWDAAGVLAGYALARQAR